MFNMFVTGGAFNYGYSNPRVDSLAKQLEVTLDPSQRRTQMTDFLRQVLKDAYVVPIIDQEFPWAMSSTLQGSEWLPMGFPYVYPIRQAR